MTDSIPKFHIAYLVPSLEVGGLERCVARLVEGLDPNRFSSIIVSMTELGDATPWFSQDCGMYALHRRGGSKPSLLWQLTRLLKTHQIDLVHSHNWGTLLEAAIARRCAGVPAHVHAEHGTVLGDLEIGPLRRQLRQRATQWGIARSSVAVCVSQATARTLGNVCNIPHEQIITLENGVPVPTASPHGRARIRELLGIPEHAILLGSIGRLHEVKNFAGLISLVDDLNCSEHEVHISIVGDGPIRAELEQQVRQMKHRNRVHLPGGRDDIGDWLSAFDIFVNSSFSEGLSLSLLEAMAIGLPSVVTRVGEHATVVGALGRENKDHTASSECGVIVEPNDPKALTSALLTLVGDPAQRVRLGNNARRRHQSSYSVEQMVTKYQQMYEKLLTRSVAPGASAIEAD